MRAGRVAVVVAAGVGDKPRSDAAERIALGLSVVTVGVELWGGLATGSLALLADAGHVFADVGALARGPGVAVRFTRSAAEVAEERRLLYVGLTRARRRLALSWAERREGAAGREGRRRPSRFLRALESGAARQRVTVLPGPPAQSRAAPDAADAALLAALREWRLGRARSDAVPAYIVAHDSLLADIVDQRPVSIAGLRRVKGMGPAKLERYGDEILALVARFGRG